MHIHCWNLSRVALIQLQTSCFPSTRGSCRAVSPVLSFERPYRERAPEEMTWLEQFYLSTCTVHCIHFVRSLIVLLPLQMSQDFICQNRNTQEVRGQKSNTPVEITAYFYYFLLPIKDDDWNHGSSNTLLPRRIPPVVGVPKRRRKDF